MSTTVTNPHCPHFRCAARLIHNSVQHSIFTYLFDEYLCNLESNKNQLVDINYSQISQESGVSRGSVKPSLKRLQELKLIYIENGQCRINFDFLYKLAILFESQKSEAGKDMVAKAFRSGDTKKLEALGIVDKDTTTP